MDESNPYKAPTADVKTPDAGTLSRKPKRGELMMLLLMAAALFFVDVIGSGNYLWSFCVCPIWFLVSIVEYIRKTKGRVALFSIAISVLTFVIAYGNSYIQCTIAAANGERIYAACEDFNRDNGRYPETLDELCPRYLRYIPRAKYCLWSGEFVYIIDKGRPGYILKWYLIPPMARMVHNSGKPGWFLVD